MPYININNKNIYYREHGSGEVIVFLNGLMMSVASWSPFIKIVSSEYKMLLVDLIDQGRSDSADGQYSQNLNVEILKQLLDELGYEKVHLFGMSYGGEVAQLFTLKYDYMVSSLILSNTTSCTDNHMKELGAIWGSAASTYDASIFCNAFVKGMYSPLYIEKNNDKLEKMEKQFSKLFDIEWYERFRRLVKSGHNFNITDRLNEIRVPTLIISSELDVITPLEYQEVLHESIPNSKWIMIKDAGHGCMYEKPPEFVNLIMEFLKV
ncbi:alpha/beta fold hydrolase [Anaerosalibacter sp. Marseille-P3206]|uniref:alpha/beta fold hydrolase n=1 Tax=Anaerosalibacter sp. Marseille-P3206 TaxID=1871005 RepID=UPI00098503C4|nr:alpha/beta hydrolase [Anaerosalibacter sp. Marseille-P3206]